MAPIMVWLIGIVVIILLVVSAGFRKFALGLVALGAAIGGFFYLKNEREESQTLARIPASQLVFENVTLKPDYSSYKMTGRIKNNSPKFTLKEVSFYITVQDCTGDSPSQSCVTIGEGSESTSLNIPPGQARDFEESVYFSGGSFKPKGRLAWNYSVSQTKAKP